MSRLLSAALVALALAAPACDTGGGGEPSPPFECWYRTTAYSWHTRMDCDGCQPTGIGDEIVCTCENSPWPCGCDMEPDPDNHEDGLHNVFACQWAQNLCYRGPPPQFYPFGIPCDCFGGYFCWRECEGRLSPDGRLVCMVDGAEQICQPEPPMDESHRVVICRHGVAPEEWPLQDWD